MKLASSRFQLVVMLTAALLSLTASNIFAQGQSGKNAAKKEMKQLNKEANKLGKKAEEAADQLGRDVVFCILAAHTTEVGTAEQLRDLFNTAHNDSDFNLQFGQFVAAVLLADRLDKEGFALGDILDQLKTGLSIGQITKDADVNMGDVRGHFGQFRSELARSLTNPPTKNCFTTTP
jgi:uncharacterized protein YpuA (DUF1002 family)